MLNFLLVLLLKYFSNNIEEIITNGKEIDKRINVNFKPIKEISNVVITTLHKPEAPI